jgi:parallel beta-helix repeat protein
MKKYCIATIIMLTLVNTPYATCWYVHPDSSMNCIEDCLAMCVTGDTVMVGPGTYYENIVWPNMTGIDLISEHGPDTTIIDGNGSASVIYMSSLLIDTSTVIQGFTIQNGYAWSGGGIDCVGYSSPLIINNNISNNTTTFRGGGINCWFGASPTITDNNITNNNSVWGGGICIVTNSDPIISNNNISANVADTAGGGILSIYGSNPLIVNNMIVNDTSLFGGGLAFYDGPGIVENNDIHGNYAAVSGGGILCTLSTVRIDSCTIAYNHAALTGGGIATSGNNNITNCSIRHNTSDAWGGGIFTNLSMDTITYNLLDSNQAVCGGGIHCRNDSPLIMHNEIIRNFASTSSGYGGGVYCWNSTATITHNLIMHNRSLITDFGAGIYSEEGSNLTLKYCNVYENIGVGIRMYASSGTIDSCTVARNIQDGIYCSHGANPVIRYSNLTAQIGGYGVKNLNTNDTVDARYNWWGDASGPGGVGPGSGTPVTTYVLYDPWLTDSVQWVGIEETSELVIEDQSSIIVVPTILNGSTLPFTIRQRCEMSLTLYDIAGRESWSAERKTYESGSHTLNLPNLTNGIYFLKFATDEQQETRKLLFVR